MRRKGTTDWTLLRSAVKDSLGDFFTLLGMGLCFGIAGGGVFYSGFGEWGAMIFGAFFALIGLALFVFSFVVTYSSIGYYYEQAPSVSLVVQ